jgi:hypothetical protein
MMSKIKILREKPVYKNLICTITVALIMLLVSACSADQAEQPPDPNPADQAPVVTAQDEAATVAAVSDAGSVTDAAIRVQKGETTSGAAIAEDKGTPKTTGSAVTSTEEKGSKSAQTKADGEEKAAPKTSDTTKDKKNSDKKDKYQTEPVPEGKPAPVEPSDADKDQKKSYNCTIFIECGKILDNIDDLDPAKTDIVPADGVIIEAKTAAFTEGESVFDVLKRETRAGKIHMEFVNTPVYNSAYIEGIANLYEFDCGALSGWVYSVNGWFPNYGCSRYQLKDGDVIEWHYTCDLGRDFGLDF